MRLPDALTTIGQYAFEKCAKLSDITFPEDLVTIWNYAFTGCAALSEIVLPGAPAPSAVAYR